MKRAMNNSGIALRSSIDEGGDKLSSFLDELYGNLDQINTIEK